MVSSVKVAEGIRRAGTTAAAVLSYIVSAVVVMQHLWADPQGRMLADNYQDQVFFEWVLTHAARLFTHGDNPFFTDQLNAPLGVNLMANTSVLGLALPLAPVTLLFGAGTTMALIETIALAGTAVGWYLVLSRHLFTSRLAAYVGALFCAFAPGMISQSTGHPNIAGQLLIPFIVWNVLRLRRPGPALRRGLVLGALVVYQCFINEEVLFLTAVAMLLFLLLYLRPSDYLPTARAALPALGVAALAAAVLLAYPLYVQFFGRQAYHGMPEFVHGFSSDLASFEEFSRRSILAPELSEIDKMGGPTEENTFFGWPLLGLIVASTVVMWRQRAARALFIIAVVFAALSLGTMIKIRGQETGWHGPWQWVHQLPLFDSVVPTRLGVAMAPLIGILLAMLIDGYVAGARRAVVATEADGAVGATAAAQTTDGVRAVAGGPGGNAAPNEDAELDEHAELDDDAELDEDAELNEDAELAEDSPVLAAVAARTASSAATRTGTAAHDAPYAEIPGVSEKSVTPGVADPAAPGPALSDAGPDDNTTASRWLWAVALVLALFPLIPTPQPAADRSAMPAFFSSGAWRDTIPRNSIVVPLPDGFWEGLDSMRWATAANLDFRIVGGYFLVPDPNDPKGTATFWPVTTPSMRILNQVGDQGGVPQITPDQRAQARADLAYWHANFLVLPEQHPNSEAVRQTAEQLFGPAQHVLDVWIWKV